MKHLRFALIAFFGLPVSSLAADVKGGEDHPLVSRFPGSEISWYDSQGFERYRIAVGPVTGYRKIDDWMDVEGRLYRINYVLRGERSFYEVYANYLNAIKRAGFEILAEGYDKSLSVRGDIGQRGFLGVHYAENPYPPGATQLLQGSSSSGGSGYFAARLDRTQGAVTVVLGATQYAQDQIIVLLDIVEQQPLEDDLVVVDAEAMGRDIDLYGKVTLYSLYFDHDKATLKGESAAALQEIATLLTRRPELQVFVVGHSDATGDFEYNLDLSARRAAEVVRVLDNEYGISDSRMSAHGVGPLVPVTTNDSDTGRVKNRRVELVQK